ncbi:tyrosine-type recombinase/integrase [Frankia sp. Mgl5]|uniref:tyrosine-type recombinase/integrase n=1 Tax=Frankia sp. Mgl5 TaxID=2933793 RepID=UPI00200BF472|nr:tyrosine-type recombinase/integrase [Frankia sp. Mgl5]MCK9926426.1 tyrosine-type recombinase/integrase [Frankia sp. Mgl5]
MLSEPYAVVVTAHTTTTIAAAAGLGEKTTAHVLRHTFATSLVRGGTELVTVAELLCHTRLETVRIYTQPTEDDKIRALDHLASRSPGWVLSSVTCPCGPCRWPRPADPGRASGVCIISPSW